MITRVRARAVVTLLALGAYALPATVEAAPAESKALDEAKALYKEGKSHYDVGDYEKALTLWKEAYTKLDDSPGMQTVRHTLVYNILEAQIRVYEVNKDITYLRTAKTLLESYLAKHKEIYEDTPENLEERTTTEARLKEVEEMLAAAEQEAADAGAPAAGAATAPQETPGQRYARLRVERYKEIQATPELAKLDRKYRNMIIGGSVSLGVGLAMLSTMGTFRTPTTLDEDGFDAGGDLTGAGFAWGAIGFAATVAGSVVLGVGASRRKKLRNPLIQVQMTPYFGPEGGGAAARIAF